MIDFEIWCLARSACSPFQWARAISLCIKPQRGVGKPVHRIHNVCSRIQQEYSYGRCRSNILSFSWFVYISQNDGETTARIVACEDGLIGYHLMHLVITISARWSSLVFPERFEEFLPHSNSSVLMILPKYTRVCSNLLCMSFLLLRTLRTEIVLAFPCGFSWECLLMIPLYSSIRSTQGKEK